MGAGHPNQFLKAGVRTVTHWSSVRLVGSTFGTFIHLSNPSYCFLTSAFCWFNVLLFSSFFDILLATKDVWLKVRPVFETPVSNFLSASFIFSVVHNILLLCKYYDCNMMYCFTILWIYITLKPTVLLVCCTFCFTILRIYITLKLRHCTVSSLTCFTILRIYITLKQCQASVPHAAGFTILRIYITLKLAVLCVECVFRFTTLRIYITLKPIQNYVGGVVSFTILWIYITLKPIASMICCLYCFTILWIYITLKRCIYVL